MDDEVRAFVLSLMCLMMVPILIVLSPFIVAMVVICKFVEYMNE